MSFSDDPDFLDEQLKKASNAIEKVEDLDLYDLADEIRDICEELSRPNNFDHEKMESIGYSINNNFDEWLRERIEYYKEKNKM